MKIGRGIFGMLSEEELDSAAGGQGGGGALRQVRDPFTETCGFWVCRFCGQGKERHVQMGHHYQCPGDPSAHYISRVTCDNCKSLCAQNWQCQDGRSRNT